jgi:hypothetical protein
MLGCIPRFENGVFHSLFALFELASLSLSLSSLSGCQAHKAQKDARKMSKV